MQAETILVVDDEQVVRRLIHMHLRRHGFTILEANSGTEAIRVCQTHKGKIHLALIDVLMPGIHGPRLQLSINKIDPEMRILFMSGFPHIESINRGMSDFISKPFRLDQLLAKVRESLATAAQHTSDQSPAPC